MRILWAGTKVTMGLFLITGLAFTSGLLGLLLYEKATHQEGRMLSKANKVLAAGKSAATIPAAPPGPAQEAAREPSAILAAPVINQYPELPSGCEVTSLAMLLQFNGFNKNKMELAEEMPKDPTPIQWRSDGSIAYWGNPNTGFVGNVTGESRGYGIYHGALLPLLQKYIPSGFDLTGGPFSDIEKQISDGIPVIVWTTIDYAVPDQWVQFDTPLGPISISFMEHAVLLVGYDVQNVYVNDPITMKQQQKIGKAQFLPTWEAMGKQALSYRK